MMRRSTPQIWRAEVSTQGRGERVAEYRRLLRGLTRPRVGKNTPSVRKQLRQHAGVADDRHEVEIATPARHDVLVQVSGDSRTGYGAEVHTEIESVRGGSSPHSGNAALREQHELGGLGSIK